MNDLPWLWMGVRPGPDATRILVQEPQCLVLKARLPDAPQHPRALETLAEGVALWCGRPLYVDGVRSLRLPRYSWYPHTARGHLGYERRRSKWSISPWMLTNAIPWLW
jgi:hypothetical protein